MSDTSHIGQVHTGPLSNDAIHIAIAQVSAGEELKAGDHVGFKEGNTVVFKNTNNIGIVDPFLKEVVKKDRLFYLFLYPNTVTSLTHQWEHPMFNRTEDKIKAADTWLREQLCDYYDDDPLTADVVEGTEWNYPRILEEFKKGDVGYYAYGTDFSDKYNSDKDGFRKKFWDNLEIVTGVLATKKQRNQEYFSCSC